MNTYFTDYINLRFKIEKTGLDVGDNKEKLASAFGYEVSTVERWLAHFEENVSSIAKEIIETTSLELDAIKDNTDTIAFIGDSITSDRESYYSIIKKAFSTISDVKFVDASISGEKTTESVTNLYPRVIAYKPQIVSVFIGTNDMRQNKDSFSKPLLGTNDYRDNIKYIIQVLKQYNAQIILNSLPPMNIERVEKAFWFHNWTYQDGIQIEYNRVLKALAKEYDCCFNDLDMIYSENDFDVMLEDDGLHLSKTAHKLVAEKLMDIVYGLLTT